MDSQAPPNADATLPAGSQIVVPKKMASESDCHGPPEPSAGPKRLSRISRRNSRRGSQRRQVATDESSIEKTVGSALRGTQQRTNETRSAEVKSDERETRLVTAELEIGSYEPLEELGRGGWGVVQRAFDRRLQREVAIKCLSSSVENQTEVRQQFEHEAKVTSQLQHPGVVPVHERGTTPDGKSFYAMKVLEGDSLRDAIRNAHGQASASTKTQLREAFLPLLPRFISVCHAVAFAHSQGVVHRDLKPANVMVGSFGETIVVDWGLAAKIPNSKTGDSRPADNVELVGTPAYMSPEQATGSREAISVSSDIYSLGVMLFEIVAGVSPCAWAEQAEPTLDTSQSITDRVLQRVIQGRLPRLTEVNRLAPKSLEAVCRKAMATNPADRYQSADELAEDVSRHVEGGVPSVYDEPLLDKAIRWSVNHKAITLVSLAAILILFVASLVFGAIITEAHASERAARRVAELSREQALGRLARARESADTWLIDLSGALQFYPGMESLRVELLGEALKEYRDLLNSPEDTVDQDVLDTPVAQIRQNLERARLLLRIHDLERLTGEISQNGSGAASGGQLLGNAKLLLNAAEQIVSCSAQTEAAGPWIELAAQIRLEKTNVFIARLLLPDDQTTPEHNVAEQEFVEQEIAEHRSWLIDRLPTRLRQNQVQESFEGHVGLSRLTRRYLSALVRLGTAASRQDAAVQQRIEQRIVHASDAVRFARALVRYEPTDASIRQFETAISSLGYLHAERGDVVASGNAWRELGDVLRQTPSAGRSDRLQSRAFAMMNQANVLATEAPRQSAMLLDEAIDVLYRAWDALDPSNFFEMNLATANYNSAKLLFADAEMAYEAGEHLREALGYYESSLRQSPTSDVLRRLAECHMLSAKLPGKENPERVKHYESAVLALQMLQDHDLAEAGDYLSFAESQFALCSLRSVKAEKQLAYEAARRALATLSEAHGLSEQMATQQMQLNAQAEAIKGELGK